MKIVPSTRKDKKWMAVFQDGTTTHFGGRGYMDFTLYYRQDPALARQKRRQYIARHGRTESWTDPRKAQTLSRYILWEKPRLADAVTAYKKRFNIGIYW